jgi:hypothetical protein
MAKEEIAHLEHTMALENQSITHSHSEIEELAQKFVNSGTVKWKLDDSKLR